MVVTVAEDGNRRKGGMTPVEAEQCINDIIAWFKRSSEVEMSEGSEEDVQPLEKAIGNEIDSTLAMLLTTCSNQVWYGEKKGLEASKITEFCMDGQFEDLLPFCADEGEEDFLVIDLKTQEVKEWDEADGVGDSIATSFNDYIEDYRNDLLAGKFEYVEDCGCLEKAGAGGGGSHK
ncbi:hypothetical protein TrRE_jg11257 [Triparma retinervis]|uniref:Knr4/Smi1-like domain-containing protein n=1 Tax=Triparma retinervis TaxID=2557542 RepID=A0A9W7AJ11_9STRA|nr:hypothetical protein TrRE_jg11257 [Triparma retinervis]